MSNYLNRNKIAFKETHHVDSTGTSVTCNFSFRIDKKEDEQDVQVLKEIMDKLCEGLQLGQKIYARRFADEHQYDMEYVHEIFAVLYPWVISTREKFEEDTVDELYGFPSIITETTPIYLALGRRDIKLEYQHKVISL
jgi:hypothetical protein